MPRWPLKSLKCISQPFFAPFHITSVCAILITQTGVPSPTIKISLSTITVVMYLGSSSIDKGDPVSTLPPQFLDLPYAMFTSFIPPQPSIMVIT